MEFDFDPRKAATHRLKHQGSFDEAMTALLDPIALAHEDSDAEVSRDGF